MQLHPNAKTTPRSRMDLVHRVVAEGQDPGAVGTELGISARTVYKWVRRYRDQGLAGLEDRRCAPHRRPHTTPEARTRQILKLRQRRWVGWKIAARLGMPTSTVYSVLRRAGLSRLSALEPKEKPRRYTRERAGEIIHLDIKPLARIQRVGHRITGDPRDTIEGGGYEYAHVAVDDASRLAYVEVLPDQRGTSAVAFFQRARRWYAQRQISIERVMTDNGSCYISRRFRQALKRYEIKHLRTRAYRPQTNGKAERFIQTLQRDWAYGRTYQTSNQRTRALPKWVRYYNDERPHRSLAGITPKLWNQRNRGQPA